MSKNNVNPDHYKVAGRERPDALAASRRHPTRTDDVEARERWEKRNRNRKFEKERAR
jgi:hypothetical protein